MPVLKAKVGGSWVEIQTIGPDEVWIGATAPTDSGVELWYDTVNQPTAVPWIAPTFQNSWVDFGSGYQVAQYRKIGDLVYLRGWVKGGTTGVAMFTLPAGFRPPAYVHFACEANDAFGELRVGPGGDVVLMAGNVTTHVSVSIAPFSVTA